MQRQCSCKIFAYSTAEFWPKYCGGVFHKCRHCILGYSDTIMLTDLLLCHFILCFMYQKHIFLCKTIYVLLDLEQTKLVSGGSYHVEKWSWCLWTKEATAGQGWQQEDIRNIQVRMSKYMRISEDMRLLEYENIT